LSSGRTKKELSERSLMVACEIAHAGSPCVMRIKVKYKYFPWSKCIDIARVHDIYFVKIFTFL
jgi:hypothetical protein